MAKGLPSLAAMYCTNRVLPQPVGSLDQHRQAISPGVLEQRDLVALRAIERQSRFSGVGVL